MTLIHISYLYTRRYIKTVNSFLCIKTCLTAYIVINFRESSVGFCKEYIFHTCEMEYSANSY